MAEKKKTSPEVNLLELIPMRLLEYETGEDGLVTLFAPRFKSRIVKRILGSRLKNKFIKIRLDEIGSAVWELCDGKRNVNDIGEEMKKECGDKIEPCFDRLALFFNQLECSEFIRYANLEELREKQKPCRSSNSIR